MRVSPAHCVFMTSIQFSTHRHIHIVYLAMCPIPPVYILNPPFFWPPVINYSNSQKGENFKTSFCCHSINLQGARQPRDLWCYFFSIFYTQEIVSFRINTQGERHVFILFTDSIIQNGYYGKFFVIFSQINTNDQRVPTIEVYLLRMNNEVRLK